MKFSVLLADCLVLKTLEIPEVGSLSVKAERGLGLVIALSGLVRLHLGGCVDEVVFVSVFTKRKTKDENALNRFFWREYFESPRGGRLAGLR
jgi:hypothetical protein